MSLAGFDANFPLNQQVDNQIYVELKPGADAAAAGRAMTPWPPLPDGQGGGPPSSEGQPDPGINTLLGLITLLLACRCSSPCSGW